MNLSTILSIAATIIASIGGAGVIICTVVKFCADMIANRLEARYEQRLSKELEAYKSKLESKIHISNARFDREFAIYQNLSETHITMVYDMGEAVAIARGMYQDDREKIEEFMQKADKHLNDAEMTNKRCAPFISKEIFDKYKALDKQGAQIMRLFGLWDMFNTNSWSEIRYHEKLYTKNDARKEIEEKQKELSALSDEILDVVRGYLESIDILED